ncbi:MATE family efflux transporter [Paramaledivibacter caminithermalis]|uniref:Probable multidrug resistance protein NorM n=1 Tax=Paramaledivibacter caminithermalis (strain DSM 15212 / CIP 107654 / DViRD3) TaxID=1121301 RepID=A0A1M6QRL9_PARC5|nr:MATE family efflux transporter [Paramaledivibacter caminithermalis]SHK22949.1 multidrug resistance protein, MATE family [Paramaledivibacter caminithermalis DSM 15212]
MNEDIRNEEQVSLQKILKITYPIILSMFSLNLMVFVDRAFVAKYSLTQFAAAMPAGNIASAISSIFIGVIGFTATLIAQYYGADKKDDCSSSMWQGVYLSVVFSLLIILISPVISNIFQLMGHESHLIEFEKQYFYLIIFSSCVQLFITAFSSLYRGIGETKITMYVGVVSNVLNMILDWIFIFGKFGFPEMGGIVGAGSATITSSIVSCIIYIILLKRKKISNQYEVFANKKLDKNLIKKLARFGFPAGIQTFVGTAYFSLLLLIIGKTGEFNLTCSNIAFTIEGISIFPIWGLGMAMSIIVGQERGAGRINNIAKALKKGLMIGLCFNLLIIIVYNLFPKHLILIFNSGGDKEKFEAIVNYTTILIRVTSIWIVFDTMQIVISNVLRAVGDTMFMMIIFTIMPFLFYIVLPYIFVVVLNLSLMWIWIVLLVYTLLMLSIVSIRFISGKWKKISVI